MSTRPPTDRLFSTMRVSIPLFLLATTGGSLVAQKKPVTQPIVSEALAGQTVALLPITMVITDPSVPAGAVLKERATLLHWVDSTIAESFVNRAPEVKWILPPELRKIFRKSGGLLPDPDQLGQSIMRTWGLQVVPDPLRSNLRRLLAVASGSRYAFIPAALFFQDDSTGALTADLSAVLADVRSGRVVWRSVAKGREGSADVVLGKALATIFPVEATGR